MKKTTLALSAAVALSSITSGALAQDMGGEASLSTEGASADVGGSSSGSRGPLRLYGGLRLGFGGEVESEVKGGGKADDDLLATIGGQVGVDYVIMDYVSLGGELRLAGVNSESRDDGDVGRDLFIDVDFKPRGRFALDGMPLEIYGALPLGVTFVSTSSDVTDPIEDAGGEFSAGPGFNLGIAGGFNYFFTEQLGVNGELAYQLYWIGSEAEISGVKSEADNTFSQFTMFANLVYAL